MGRINPTIPIQTAGPIYLMSLTHDTHIQQSGPVLKWLFGRGYIQHQSYKRAPIQVNFFDPIAGTGRFVLRSTHLASVMVTVRYSAAPKWWFGRREWRCIYTNWRQIQYYNQLMVATTLTNAPIARAGHIAAWCNNVMCIYGGSDSNGFAPGGGRYNPVTAGYFACFKFDTIPLSKELIFFSIWSRKLF